MLTLARYDVGSYSILQSPLFVKVAGQSYFLVPPCALSVSGTVTDYSCKMFTNWFPAHAYVKCLLIVLLLSGDIALNPGPINFDFVNCHSVRNKGPLDVDILVLNKLDILVLAETHILNSDSYMLQKSLTLLGLDV